MQLIPLVASRGMLAYLVPASHSALTLAINMPQYKAIVLALPNSGPAAARVGKPLISFEDPDTLTLNVLGLSRAPSIGKNSAAAGKEYLILDLLLRLEGRSGHRVSNGRAIAAHRTARIRFRSTRTRSKPCRTEWWREAS